MRPTHLALLAVLLAGPPLAAQAPTGGQPAPAPAPTSPDPALLDSLLQMWESKMKGLNHLETRCERVEVSGPRRKKQTFTGTARLLKPSMFKLDLTGKEDPNEREFYVSSGSKFYEYKVKEKLIRVHDLPKNTGAISDDTFLSLLNGMPAAVAKQRYTISLKKAVPNDWYVYVHILPKLPADKQEFQEVEMVLYSPDIGKLDPGKAGWAFLPARLWFKSPNGDEVTWTFTGPNTQIKLEPKDFVPPRVEGWRVEEAAPRHAPAPGAPVSNYTVPNPNVPPTKVRQ